jgi:hypothetical protein
MDHMMVSEKQKRKEKPPTPVSEWRANSFFMLHQGSTTHHPEPQFFRGKKKQNIPPSGLVL